MRGLGLGILLTAIILSIGARKEELTDQEIIDRAGRLGMVMAEEDKLKDMLTTTPTDNDGKAVQSDTDNADNHSDNFSEGTQSDTDNADNHSDNFSEGTQTGTDNADNLSDTTDDAMTSDTSDKEAVTGTDTEADTALPQTYDEPDTAVEDEGTQSGTDNADKRSDNAEETGQSGTDNADTSITFTIIRGMSSGMVADLLQKENLIEDAEEFNNYLISEGKASVIRIGTYTLPRDAVYKDIVNAITK